MDGSNDRQRKDRLIQTRVPQNLESTLKDEARKRRLSVSHLIRNVLEDTFHLVDNVVNEVDRVVADSVGMAQTLRRDAQRLAATARGHTYHRREPAPFGDDDADESEFGDDEESDERASSPHEGTAVPGQGTLEPVEAHDEETVAEAMQAIEAALSEPPPAMDSATIGSLLPAAMPAEAGLMNVYALQEAVVYRTSLCRRCGTPLRRGTRAYLGLQDGLSRGADAWLCLECTDALPDDDSGLEP